MIILKVVKKYKEGLLAKYKLIGQVSVGIIVGLVIYYAPQFEGINTITTIPFLKNYQFDFSFFYIPIIIFIITATSNAVNLTDGLDGLATGTVGIVIITLGIIAYISGNVELSKYLNIIYLKGNGELVIFCTAIAGAAIGFLWYNSYPAQIFMGDTGSLALGGAIGTLCILSQKRIFASFIRWNIFCRNSFSFDTKILFQIHKKKYGEGKRVFLMAPIHHHFEMKGIPEPKIVLRFYIIAVLLAIMTLATFQNQVTNSL